MAQGPHLLRAQAPPAGLGQTTSEVPTPRLWRGQAGWHGGHKGSDRIRDPKCQAGPSQGCLHASQGQRPKALRGSEAPGLPSGSNSLGGNSRHTGHLMQAGCAPFSVNLLSGSACFHGDLTSEIFHLGCQMPVDEAKPPRVTKYRHGPTGSGGRASSGFGWEPGPPPPLGLQPLPELPCWAPRWRCLGPVLRGRTQAVKPRVHSYLPPTQEGLGRSQQCWGLQEPRSEPLPQTEGSFSLGASK